MEIIAFVIHWYLQFFLLLHLKSHCNSQFRNWFGLCAHASIAVSTEKETCNWKWTRNMVFPVFNILPPKHIRTVLNVGTSDTVDVKVSHVLHCLKRNPNLIFLVNYLNLWELKCSFQILFEQPEIVYVCFLILVPVRSAFLPRVCLPVAVNTVEHHASPFSLTFSWDRTSTG